MKKFIILMILLLIAPITIFITGCDNNKNVDSDTNVQQLAFYPLDDGNYGVGIGNATQLTSIIIPDYYLGKKVTQIIENGFKNSIKLTNINIGENIEIIDDYAFYGCSNLNGITIPSKVEKIGKYAFGSCSGLKTTRFLGTIKQWANIDMEYSPISYSHNLFIGSSNESITSITASELDGITEIKSHSFNNLQTLTKIEMPSSVTAICSWAFADCNSLKKVTLDNNVTTIGESAFLRCSSLESVALSDNLINISNFAFYDCSSLLKIIIPRSVGMMGNEIFYGCSALTIYFEMSSPDNWSNWNMSDLNPSNRPVYWYSETQPTTTGNYWHYVNGMVTKWN